MWNFSQMNAREQLWWQVNIDSGNGLVPSGNKPLPDPMLTQIYVTIWCHQATMNYFQSKKKKLFHKLEIMWILFIG